MEDYKVIRELELQNSEKCRVRDAGRMPVGHYGARLRAPNKIFAGDARPWPGSRPCAVGRRARPDRGRGTARPCGRAVDRGPWGLGQTVGRHVDALSVSLYRHVGPGATLRQAGDDPT